LHQRKDASASESQAGLLRSLLDLFQYHDELTGSTPVERLRLILDANSLKRQGRKNLAALVGVSPSHITRQFRETYGCTPMQYLRRLRVQTAQSMISENLGTLEYIAKKCGFARAGYMAKCIKEETGQTLKHLRTPRKT
jgi:transcriptional regulator GlxA family with amidase domain